MTLEPPPAEIGRGLSEDEHQSLLVAMQRLRHRSFAAGLADLAAQPVDATMKLLPRSLTGLLGRVVRSAVFKGLEVAADSLGDDAVEAPSDLHGKIVTGVTGGLGGFFGLAALPFELPLTTVLMLRVIAGIARSEGEDLSTAEARLACLEVFALGGGGVGRDGRGIDYFAVRAMLARLTADAATLVVERGALNASSPAISRFVAEIVARFGLVVSERVAATAVPVIGALGGATINVLFMDHFQRLARGHFAIRRLERAHGVETIRRQYEAEASRHTEAGA
jgi:hypothetical protein